MRGPSRDITSVCDSDLTSHQDKSCELEWSRYHNFLVILSLDVSEEGTDPSWDITNVCDSDLTSHQDKNLGVGVESLS